MIDHPDDAAIERFVLGALEGDALETFAAHVASCDACSARLEREARLEIKLVEVQAERRKGVVELAPRRRRMRAILAGAALLAAAAVVLLVLRGHRATSPSAVAVSSAPIPLVVCPVGPDQMRCVTDAHRHGLYVQYPEWAGAPPLGGRRAPGAGPVTSPFFMAGR